MYKTNHQINYKMTLQYDGTRYKGWQKQPGSDSTIQGKLETLLSRQFGCPIEVLGAGRTDAGVHARGQVANFWVAEEKVLALFPEAKDALRSETNAAADAALFARINQYLPEDIALVNLTRAADRFHARYLTSAKWYQYKIRISPVSDVFNRRFLWQYGEPLDTDAMFRASRALIGEHDFTSYCGLKMKKSAVRDVTAIDISRPDPDTVILDFRGEGFLNHMVRLITGTFVEVGAGRLPEDAPARILEECRKGAAPVTAPACGLTLMEVTY